MARIRSIKPEFFCSEDIAQLSIPARLLYIGLWSYADDAGRFRDSLALIRGTVFPLDEALEKAQLAAWYDELLAAGLVVRYEAGGRCFAYIPTFSAHQKPKYPTASKLPAPPEAGQTPPFPCPEASPALGEDSPVSGEGFPDPPQQVGVGVGEGAGEQPPPPLAVTGEAAMALPLLDAPPPEPPRRTKAPKATKARDAPQFPAFDQAHCDRLWQRWRQAMGHVEFPRFRKLFGPVYQLAADLADAGTATVTVEQLDDAFEALVVVAPRGPAMRHLTPVACADMLHRLAKRRAEVTNEDRRLEVTFELVHGRSLPTLKRAS